MVVLGQLQLSEAMTVQLRVRKRFLFFNYYTIVWLWVTDNGEEASATVGTFSQSGAYEIFEAIAARNRSSKAWTDKYVRGNQ